MVCPYMHTFLYMHLKCIKCKQLQHQNEFFETLFSTLLTESTYESILQKYHQAFSHCQIWIIWCLIYEAYMLCLSTKNHLWQIQFLMTRHRLWFTITWKVILWHCLNMPTFLVSFLETSKEFHGTATGNWSEGHHFMIIVLMFRHSTNTSCLDREIVAVPSLPARLNRALSNLV